MNFLIVAWQNRKWIALAASIGLTYWVGYNHASETCQREKARLESEAAAARAAVDAANDIIAANEAANAQAMRAKINQLRGKLHANRKKDVGYDCPVPADGVRLINTAIE